MNERTQEGFPSPFFWVHGTLCTPSLLTQSFTKCFFYCQLACGYQGLGPGLMGSAAEWHRTPLRE